MGRCSITLKKGEKILSSLQSISTILLYSLITSFIWTLFTHRSRKNWLSSVRTFHTLSGNNSLVAIGNKHSIKTWQSWLFKLCNHPFVRSTHLLKLKAYPSGNFKLHIQSHNAFLCSLFSTYAAGGITSLRCPSLSSVTYT